MAKKKSIEEFDELELDEDLDEELLSEDIEDVEGIDISEDVSDQAEIQKEEESENYEADFDEVREKKAPPINMDAAYEDPETKAKWYVVHTYSGHEMKVKVNIEKIVENRGMQDLVLSIVVPTEDVVEIKNGQRKVKTRKMFPGYVIVKMLVTNESWYLVRNTQGVTGFVGHGSEPVPLTNDEVRRMGIEKVYVELDIDVSDSVKVISGPFEGFMGVVEEVNMDKQILKVKISMFGRDTPVELEFNQVDKL